MLGWISHCEWPQVKLVFQFFPMFALFPNTFWSRKTTHPGSRLNASNPDSFHSSSQISSSLSTCWRFWLLGIFLKNPRPKNFNPEKTAGLPYYTCTLPFWEIQCPQKPFFRQVSVSGNSKLTSATPARSRKQKLQNWIENANVYVSNSICIPRAQMTLVLIEKGLILEGWSSKTEVGWVLGVYDMYIFIYIWISFWFTFKERFQTPIPQNHWLW